MCSTRISFITPILLLLGDKIAFLPSSLSILKISGILYKFFPLESILTRSIGPEGFVEIVEYEISALEFVKI